jgi:hypothetical protein
MKFESDLKDKRMAELEAALSTSGKKSSGPTTAGESRRELDDFIAHHKRMRLHDPVWRTENQHSKTKPDVELVKTPSDGSPAGGTTKKPT